MKINKDLHIFLHVHVFDRHTHKEVSFLQYLKIVHNFKENRVLHRCVHAIDDVKLWEDRSFR